MFVYIFQWGSFPGRNDDNQLETNTKNSESIKIFWQTNKQYKVTFSVLTVPKYEYFGMNPYVRGEILCISEWYKVKKTNT